MRTLKSTPLALTVGSQTLGAEGVARDRGADPRGKQQIVPSDQFSADVRRNFLQPGLTDAECPRLVVLRVPLHEEALTGRRVLLGRLDDGVLNTDHASQEVDVSWPQRDDLAQRIPVSINVSTSSRCCEGSARRRRSNSSGVTVRDLRRITFGSSVWSHGLKTRIRSRTARRKIEDKNTWYFLIDRGERPSACALVTQSWTTEGETLFSCRLPDAG